ncbi:uncharacterized protein AAEQ78_012045 [Lycaon pictus]
MLPGVGIVTRTTCSQLHTQQQQATLVGHVIAAPAFTVKKKLTIPTRNGPDDPSKMGCPGQGHSMISPAGSSSDIMKGGSVTSEVISSHPEILEAFFILRRTLSSLNHPQPSRQL